MLFVEEIFVSQAAAAAWSAREDWVPEWRTGTGILGRGCERDPTPTRSFSLRMGRGESARRLEARAWGFPGQQKIEEGRGAGGVLAEVPCEKRFFLKKLLERNL